MSRISIEKIIESFATLSCDIILKEVLLMSKSISFLANRVVIVSKSFLRGNLHEEFGKRLFFLDVPLMTYGH